MTAQTNQLMLQLLNQKIAAAKFSFPRIDRRLEANDLRLSFGKKRKKNRGLNLSI